MSPFGKRINSSVQSKTAVNKKTLFKTGSFIWYKALGFFTTMFLFCFGTERWCVCLHVCVGEWLGVGGVCVCKKWENFFRVCPCKVFLSTLKTAGVHRVYDKHLRVCACVRAHVCVRVCMQMCVNWDPPCCMLHHSKLCHCSAHQVMSAVFSSDVCTRAETNHSPCRLRAAVAVVCQGQPLLHVSNTQCYSVGKETPWSAASTDLSDLCSSSLLHSSALLSIIQSIHCYRNSNNWRWKWDSTVLHSTPLNIHSHFSS